MAKRLWIIFSAVLFLILLPLAYYMSSQHSASADIDAIRKAGFPTNYAELDAMQPQDGENAAPIYAEIATAIRNGKQARALRTLQDAAFAKPGFNGMSSAEAKSASAELSPLITRVIEASKLPRCVFGKAKIVDGMRNDAEDPLNNNRVAMMLEMDSELQFATGHETRGYEELLAVSRMTRQESRDVGVMEYTVAQLHGTIAVSTMGDYVAKHPHDRRAIQTMLDLTDAQGADPNALSAYRGIVAQNLSWLMAYAAEPSRYRLHDFYTGGHPQKPSPLLRNPIVFRVGVNQMIHAWRTVVEAMPKDASDTPAMEKALAKGKAEVLSKWPAKALFPLDGFSELAAHSKDLVATRRLAKASALALLYRLDHGSLPATLPVTGNDAIDPYTDKPISYVKKGDGFRVEAKRIRLRPPIVMEFK